MTPATILTALAMLPLVLTFAAQGDKKVEADGARTTKAQIGAAAPAFSLNDHEGKLVRIGGAAKRWTVLAFYPKALTGG